MTSIAAEKTDWEKTVTKIVDAWNFKKIPAEDAIWFVWKAMYEPKKVPYEYRVKS